MYKASFKKFNIKKTWSPSVTYKCNFLFTLLRNRGLKVWTLNTNRLLLREAFVSLQGKGKKSEKKYGILISNATYYFLFKTTTHRRLRLFLRLIPFILKKELLSYSLLIFPLVTENSLLFVLFSGRLGSVPDRLRNACNTSPPPLCFSNSMIT